MIGHRVSTPSEVDEPEDSDEEEKEELELSHGEVVNIEPVNLVTKDLEPQQQQLANVVV